MEIKKFLANLVVVCALTSCTNTPDLETGEIQTFQMIKQAFEQRNQLKGFVDARTLLNREQIDAAKTPVIFVELNSGQNGTLTPYPGKGVGQTWLGADGATITLEQGILIASRGMGDDRMGSSSSMPSWSQINKNLTVYKRELSYIDGNNKILNRSFECSIKKNYRKERINIWEVGFLVTKFEERCDNSGFEIKNTYYLDAREIVRKSSQYHGDTIGYIIIERIDR